MGKEEYCDRCLSHIDRIERSEMDIQKLDSSVSTIKTWVITGAAILILHFGLALFKLFTG
ncbi:MAG TPA: hypothetical protein EYP60_04345 [bacterium (Candidatus Stahlbacteria)]|nr:hypothetical protein [Candidatus Stahlbacteria bacterium]